MLAGCQCVVLATAMVVSSTVLFLAFSKDISTLFPQLPKNLHHHHQQQSAAQNLRSCLSSEEKRKERRKKKRVKFADNVKESKGNGEEYRRSKQNRTINVIPKTDRICRDEISEIPPNRMARYNGILRDRLHGTECSY